VTDASGSPVVGISRLHHPVTNLGIGRRAGIWFQGCTIRCAGCVSQDTWPAASDTERVPLEQVTDWVDGLPHGEIDGITISGGEPFDQPEALAALTSWLRRRFDPSRVDVLVYTGYTRKVVAGRHAAILANVDVLMTEPYRANVTEQLRWRGSANQRMVLLTPLARQRYAPHASAPADTRLQVDVVDGRLRFIGIPRPGDMQRVAAGLAAQGVLVEDCSWNS
jgi:anaerobic ribonucleoside-triphosphate reductase activating protein